MSEVAAGFLAPCQFKYLFCGFDSFSRGKWTVKLKKQELQYHATTKLKPLYQITVKAATYSSRIATDIALYESPGAMFDHYLENRPRVFEAVFPDKRRSQRINKEEWRVQMLPINFLFLTVWPVVDMRLRCKSEGIDYPPEIPCDITKVLELDITRWELQGLDNSLKPSDFTLCVKGVLYPDRTGTRSRLKGQLEMSINFVLPPMIAWIPEDVRQNVADSILGRLVENMKHKVNRSLLADYSKFKRERANNPVQAYRDKKW
ncbi:hypothetical protein SLA2020_295630 [Shorea laevis]